MIKPGIYQHYKGFDYEVFDVAKHSETEQWMVLYKPLYGDEKNRHLWVRPLDMFTETITHNGKQVSRFAYIRK